MCDRGGMRDALRIIGSIMSALAGAALCVFAIGVSFGQAMTEQPFDAGFILSMLAMLGVAAALMALGVWLGRSAPSGTPR